MLHDAAAGVGASFNGSMAVCGCGWRRGLLKRELSGHDDLVRSLHLDGVNGRLISGSYDHSVRVWDSKSGTTSFDGGLKMNLEGWTSSWMLAAKSNYRKIACASQDGRVVIVDFGFGINGVDLVEA